MRKIRILAAVLAVLMLPLALLFSCGQVTEQVGCTNGEHNFPKKWETVQKRTCTLDEIEQATCKTCGFVKQQVANKATGHVFESANRVSNNDATCTEDGQYIIECTWCNATQTEPYPGSALGHKFVNYEVIEGDAYVEKAFCINCNAGTDTRILGINLDMEGNREHLTYGAMEIFTGTNGTSEFTTVNGSTALVIKRPAGDVVGSSAYGIVLSPRTDILENAQYVIEFEVVLANVGGNVTFTGTKAYGGQKMDFVTYNKAENRLEVVSGPAYALTAADANGMKIAVVTNDTKRMYDLYVNNVLVAASVGYIDDFYNGFGIGTFDIVMAEGNTASEIAVDNVKLYNGNKPQGYEGAENEMYTYDKSPAGEYVISFALDADCDHNFTYEKVVKNCAAYSYILKTCSVCNGGSVTQWFAPADHKYVYSHSTAATCWTPGFECQVCTVCGAKDGKQVEAQLQHQLGTNVTVIEPTCTTPGSTTGACTRCGYEYTDPSKNVPVLGHTVNLEHADTKVVIPTCTTEGYTEGPCVRCEKVIKPDSLKMPATGHTCFNPIVIEATCGQKGYTQNVCDECNAEYISNEVDAYPHTEFSRVNEGFIETVCVMCGNSKKLAIVDILPSAEQQIDYINANGTMLVNASLDDGKVSNCGNLIDCNGGKTYTQTITTKARLQFVARYAEFTLRNAAVGKYLNVKHQWQNHYTAASPNTNWNHTYMNVYTFSGTATSVLKPYRGATFIFEYNIRPNEYQFGGMGVECIERNNEDGSSSTDFSTALIISQTGDILANDPRNGNAKTLVGKIDVTDTKTWTRIALAVDTTNKTQSVYVNGVLMTTSKTNGNDKDFPYVEEFRCNFYIPGTNNSTNSKNWATADTIPAEYQGPAGMDLDEIYAYVAAQPLYITGLNRYDSAEINVGEATNEAGQNYISALGAAKLGYTGAETWTATTEEGKTVVAYEKNGNGVQLPGALESNSSGIEITDLKSHVAWTNIDVKFPVVDGVTIDIMKGVRDYKKLIEVTEPETPETPEVVEEGEEGGEGEEEEEVPQYEYYKEEQVYLVLENGYLKTIDGHAICKVNANQWYNISFITKEKSGVITYEVYVDGIYYRTCEAKFTTGDLKETVTKVDDVETIVDPACGPKTVFLAGKTNCKYVVSDIAVYGDIQVPDIYKARLENDATIAGDETVLFQATENYNVNNLVKWYNNMSSAIITVPAVEEGAEPTSYLELRKPERTTIYAGYEVAKAGLNRKVGDAAGDDFKWTVKAGDFKTNCNNAAKTDIFRIDTMEGVPASAQGGYDLSGYAKIKVRFFVEETDGYNFLLYFFSGVDEATGKDKFLYKYLTVSTAGWYTFEIDLDTLGDDNKTADIANIEYISMYVSGWAKIGDIKDGTTIYMESITLIAEDQVCADTGYLKKDTACTGDHTFDDGKVVAPTCTEKGYTVKTCTLDTCGVKVITDVVPAKGHTNNAGEVVAEVSTPATCEKNGVEVKKFTCSACEAETYTTTITVATGHNLTNGATTAAKCDEDGYIVVTCGNANCDYADIAEKRVVLPATGHISDGTTKVVAPTCDAIGGTQTVCTSCNNPYIVEGTEVPALGHSMVDKANGRVEPQCEVDGSNTKICANGCGKEETTAIPATGHDMVETSRVPAENGVNGKVVYTCANGCGKTEETVIVAFPTNAEMDAAITTLFGSLKGEGVAAGSFKGEKNANGINAAFAKWTTKDSYIDILAVPENGEVVSNFKTTVNGNAVIEFNVKANLDVFAGLKVKATINGSEQTVLAIANTGKITFNGNTEPNAAIDIQDPEMWSRIALVFDTEGKTIDFYFDGYYYRSVFYKEAYTVSDITISVGEGSTAGCGLSLDDIYVYAGKAPVFNNGVTDTDDAKIEFTSNWFTNKDNTLAKSNLWNKGLIKKMGVTYKNKYKVTQTEEGYLHIEKNEKFGNYGTEDKKDSWITVQDLGSAKTIHMSMRIKFDMKTSISILGCFRRTYKSGLTGNHETKNPLEFTGTKWKFFGTEVGSVTLGEWYDIDVYIENRAPFSAQFYVNGVLLKSFETFPTNGTAHKYTDDYEINAQFMRAFNVSNNANDHDITVAKWDINFDRKMPTLPQA